MILPLFQKLKFLGSYKNSLDQAVKSGDLTRGYTSRGRNSSYFGLFLAFWLLFWTNFGTVLCHVNGMGRVYS